MTTTLYTLGIIGSALLAAIAIIGGLGVLVWLFWPDCEALSADPDYQRAQEDE